MTGMEALLYYVLWMILLVVVYIGHRVPLVLLGKKAANYWTRGSATDDAGWQVRTQHAHANAVENVALFATVVLAAYALGKQAAVDTLAPYVLYARVGQSVIHMLGTSFLHVLIRATLFFVQIVLIVLMAFKLLG